MVGLRRSQRAAAATSMASGFHIQSLAFDLIFFHLQKADHGGESRRVLFLARGDECCHAASDEYLRPPAGRVHARGRRLALRCPGRRYLDALAGIAVNTLGHAHPRLTRALAEQAARLIHTSNLYRDPASRNALADQLARISGMDEVFFCNSGCEANEAAIKLARLYGHQQRRRQPGHRRHGEGLPRPHAGHAVRHRQPQGAGRLRAAGARVSCACPTTTSRRSAQVAEHNRNVVAVLVELDPGRRRHQCRRRELPAGLARALRRARLAADARRSAVRHRPHRQMVRAIQHAGIMPGRDDAGQGARLAACRSAPALRAGAAAGVFKPGNHGSTFGGNPLACAAALTTLEVIEEEGLMANARSQLGDAIRAGLRSALAGVPAWSTIRGEGLMIGIELDRPCGDLVDAGLHAGLLINVTADNGGPPAAAAGLHGRRGARTLVAGCPA